MAVEIVMYGIIAVLCSDILLWENMLLRNDATLRADVLLRSNDVLRADILLRSNDIPRVNRLVMLIIVYVASTKHTQNLLYPPPREGEGGIVRMIVIYIYLYITLRQYGILLLISV